MARPYPTGSGVGLLASDALLSTPDGALVDVGAARGTIRWVDRGSDAAGVPLGTGTQLLGAHRAAAEPATAVVVPEQALVQSNRRARVDGRGVLPDCGSATAPRAA
ncbi:hypothetical protein ACFQV2_07985 [Actinokineospora soli]|uniref:Uncharacterized protein n=1 Tax=Actinokineospora soli TaxID=1048753 RepID=A0ABW2TIQ2_9PSEU